MTREVTEQDFRKPEYVNAKVEDYEFREDGALVRKDRWETGMISIKHLVLHNKKDWEISDVIDQVRELCEDAWLVLGEDEPPEHKETCDIMLECGSILVDATYADNIGFVWSALGFEPIKWRKNKTLD